MIRLITFATRYPVFVLVMLALITALAATRLPHLQVQVTFDKMMLEGDPAGEAYRQMQEVYGAREDVLLFVRDAHLLQADRVRALQTLVADIESLDFVAASNSLFSINDVRVDEEGEVHSTPYLDAGRLPQNLRDREQWLQNALRNPLVDGQFLGREGAAIAILITPGGVREEGGFSSAELALLKAEVSAIQGLFEQAFLFGPPLIREATEARVMQDQHLLLPLSLGLLLLLLGLILRHLNGAVVPLLTGLLSVSWTLGLMAQLDIPLTVMTSIVPALLVIVGCTEDIHLLAEFYAGRNSGLDRHAALDRMIRRVGLAVLLTAFTTAVGFLSVAINPIPMLREFGQVAAIGMVFNFLITVLLVPAWLRLFGGGVRSDPGERESSLGGLALSLTRMAMRYRLLVLSGALVCVVVAVAGALRIQINNDPLGYFDPGDALIGQLAAIQRDLSGAHGFTILLDAEIEETFQQVRYLQAIRDLQQFLAETGSFRQSYSFADVVAFVNLVMEGGTGPPFLPDEDAIVREYLLFLERAAYAEYVSPDFSQARIRVRHDLASSQALAEALEALEAYLSTRLPRGLDFVITGEEVMTQRAADHMVLGQALSLLLVLFVIWALVSLLFVNPRAGWIAVITNFIPITLLFGVMGWFSVPLDTGTAMVAAIAVGICVDDSMHFMTRFHHRSQGQASIRLAIEETVRQEAVPIIGTSLALALGFLVLVFSGFPPVARFGWLSAMVVLAALLATFLIMPLLLSSIRLVSLWDMLDLKLRARVRRQCLLFRDMRSWQIKKLILLGEVMEVPAGETLFHQGDPSEAMYLVLEGRIEVWKGDALGMYPMATRGEGEVLGEAALLGQSQRTRSAVALEPTRVLVLRWESMRRIARMHPRLSARFFRNLSILLGSRPDSRVREDMVRTLIKNTG